MKQGKIALAFHNSYEYKQERKRTCMIILLLVRVLQGVCSRTV